MLRAATPTPWLHNCSYGCMKRIGDQMSAGFRLYCHWSEASVSFDSTGEGGKKGGRAPSVAILSNGWNPSDGSGRWMAIRSGGHDSSVVNPNICLFAVADAFVLRWRRIDYAISRTQTLLWRSRTRRVRRRRLCALLSANR